MNERLLELSRDMAELHEKLLDAARRDLPIDPQWTIDARNMYAELHKMWHKQPRTSGMFKNVKGRRD